MKTLVTILCCLVACVSLVNANDSLNVRQVGFCNIPERGSQLNVVGNYAYCAALGGGLRIIDCSDPTIPVEVGNFRPEGVWSEAYDVAVVGDHAFVEDYYLGMRVVNVSNPASPSEVGSYQHYSDGRGIAASSNYAYIAADYLGLRIVDVSNPNAPTLVGSISVSARSHHVTVSGSYAYLSLFDPYSVAIIDISNPSNPVAVGSYPGTWVCTAVDGNYAYLADGMNGMRILDVSNPTSPTVVGNYDPAWGVGRITISGSFAYVGSDSGLRVLDISDFNAIREVGYYFIPSMPHDNDIVVHGSYAYVACGGTPGFGALRIFDCSEATSVPCPPMSLPFIDTFDSPELDSCWTWIREDTSHWGLTERPGWLRIVTQAGTMFESSDAHNLLLRPRPTGDFEISCKLEIAPTENFHGAGIIIYNNDTEFVKVTRHYAGENIISFQGTLANGPNIWIPDEANSLQLRLRLRGNLLTGEWSTNGVDWSYAGTCSFGWLSQSELRVGMLAFNGNQDGLDAAEIPADFDYFRVDSLPGTQVCGNVSGVWDSTGSPYYVTCDVTVPAGQTLEIRPGVQVLFAGQYKFNVLGNLQAIGTVQDSVVFTRAFPTEESKWKGLEILSANDTCEFHYCRIEYASDPNGWGGGALVDSSSLLVDHCLFQYNYSTEDGGGMLIQRPPYCLIRNSLFRANSSIGSGGEGGGALMLSWNGHFEVKNCVFEGNSTGQGQNGGALMIDQVGFYPIQDSSMASVENCTFFANHADGAGGAIRIRGNSEVKNCIAWNNTANVTSEVSVQYGTFNMSYSDIQGGYPGIGNIDSDPEMTSDFHLQSTSPCIDTGDPASPLDPDGSRADMGAFYYHHEPPCPPTELPFVDDFDSPELDSCWSWIREDTSHWSLTERPGWMRIETQPGRIYYGNGYNYLLCPKPSVDYVVQTKLSIDPTHPYQQGGLLLFRDVGNMVEFVRGEYEGTQYVYATVWNDGVITDNPWTVVTDSLVFLRIQSIGQTLNFTWSTDGQSWASAGAGLASWAENDSVSIGLKADESIGGVTYLPVDFDYFRIDSLTGTTVCGNVSGVWDLTGSPYYVTCDVTVPAGQTLEIQPGVEVLFTGHYKFSVLGDLQAIGTEQDSIVFTRALPTEASKWAGIKILSATDTCRFKFCAIEFAHFTHWPGEDPGGGLFADNTAIRIENCTFRNNFSIEDGGGAYLQRSPYSIVSNSVFLDNSCTGGGGEGGGGLALAWNGFYEVSKCLFAGNSAGAGQSGGGLAISLVGFYPNHDNSTAYVTNCTFVNNHADGIGGAIQVQGNGVVRNSICVGNTAGNMNEIGVQIGSFSVTFSDIEGGYPGTGNFDSDPLFVDAVNGDFNLQAGSPCINTGDPTSPLDPDGSRADMGAFPYFNPPVCGSVNGTWYANSSVKVACDVVVPEGETLTIEPGVTVEFLGPYSINVEGTLLALGSASDSILFTTDTLTNPEGWHGIRFLNAEPASTLDYCIMEYGKVTGLVDSGYGGAVYCSESSPTISHSTFRHNTARNGGGVNLNINCNAVISNCIFEDNDALERGGGLWIWDSAPVLTGCVFNGNSAITGGGAIRARQNVRLTMDSCIVTGNEGTSFGGGIFASAQCSLWVTNSVFDSNHAQQGGGWYSDSAFIFVDACGFEGNTAQWGGAANINRSMTGSTITSSRYIRNRSIAVGTSGAGGAISIFGRPINIDRCLFDGNSARLGGTLEVTGTHGYFDNCTFVNNSASVSGSIGYSWLGHHHYSNGIFASNAALAAFFLDGGSSTSTVQYSDWNAMPLNFANIAAPVGFHVLNSVNVNGDSVDTYGNLFMNPQFGVGEYDLQWSSPSIDAGDAASAHDLDGTAADQGWKPYYQPTLVVSPDTLSFGTMYFGDTLTLELAVINPSPTSAPILHQSFSNAGFSMDSLPNWIVAGDTIVVPVEFSPAMEGSYSEILRIVTSQVGADTIDVRLTANVPLVPSQVDSLVITLGALNGTQLYWKPVTTTTSGQPFVPSFYVIWGSTTPEGPYTPFGVSATTSYHHPFIVNTQGKYFYVVTASDASAVMGLKEHVKEMENGE